METLTMAPASRSETSLQDLIPIVMVITGGCESCAENLVRRALEQGSSPTEIERTLRVVADLQKRECFAKAVGPEVVARMEKPLAAGWRTLGAATAAVK